MIKRIHIVGFHDARNKGDLAILEGEIEILKDELQEAKISVSATYPETLVKIRPDLSVHAPLIDLRISYHKSLKNKIGKICYPLIILEQMFLALVSIFCIKIHLPFGYRLDTLKCFKEADLIALTGGGYLKEGFFNLPQNVYSKVAHIGLLVARAFDVIVSKRAFKKPVVLFPQSIGPFKTKLGLFIAKVIFANLDFVILREPYSMRMLENITIDAPLRSSSDIALLFSERNSTDLPVMLSIGVSPRLGDFDNLDQHQYISAHSKVLDYFVEKYGARIIFLPSNITPGLKDDDLAVCLEIQRNMMRKNGSQIIELNTAKDLKSCIGGLHLLITTRMHAGIMAALENVPFLFIVCEHKQIGFLKQLGLEEVALDIKHVTCRNLLSKTLFVFTESERIREQLAFKVPALKEHVRITVKQVLRELSDKRLHDC